MATLSGKRQCFLDYYGYAVSQSEQGYKMCILMELCNGTLMDIISQKNVDGSRFSTEEIRNKFHLLLDGFLYLENCKIYHQDVKPHNIFISKSGMLKIADFNVSHILDDYERTYTPTGVHPIQGTAGYMAPELQNVLDARAKNPNFFLNLKYKRGKADCYSLGLTFWQMLTMESKEGFNRLDQITIDQKLSDIQPLWIKNMLSSMLKVDYHQRATFKKAIAFIPHQNTMQFNGSS